MSTPPPASERVLATLNKDGSRRWIRPRLSPGRFLRARFAFGWALIAIFVLIPHLRIGHRPLILLDVLRREFILVGHTFLATDLFFLTLLLVGALVGIFLVTAVLGRVWCGWACPQTVYLELLFRPLERWIEGGPATQRRLDRLGPSPRRHLKNAVFLLISTFLAHTFLAYFVGWDSLLYWVQGSPAEHPLAFLVMAGTTALVFLDFGWFREQACLVACPYGRFQSVLLDQDSLIIGYDGRRGEPRRMIKHRRSAAERGGAAETGGDCIDCQACVTTCPTGIDIRDGLQMECIGCAQCIDACDAIMDRVDRPRGLIRYSSQSRLANRSVRWLRPRTLLYPAILVLTFGLFAHGLLTGESADVTFLRRSGTPFTELPDGTVSGQVRIKIQNRSEAAREYLFELADFPQGRLIAPENPLPVPAGGRATASMFVMAPRESFPDGRREVQFRVSDGEDFAASLPYLLLGPTAPLSAGSKP